MDVDIQAVLAKAQDLTPARAPGRANTWLMANMSAVYALRARSFSWADIARLFHRENYAAGAFASPDGGPLAGDTLRKKCERAGYRPEWTAQPARDPAAEVSAAGPPTVPEPGAEGDRPGGDRPTRLPDAGAPAGAADNHAAGPHRVGRSETAGEPAHVPGPPKTPAPDSGVHPPTRGAGGGRTGQTAAHNPHVPHRKEDLLRKRDDTPVRDRSEGVTT